LQRLHSPHFDIAEPKAQDCSKLHFESNGMGDGKTL